MYYAHSENPRGAKHELQKHLLETAQRAESFAPAEMMKRLFYLAGLLHDVGKFQDDFQEYLEKGKPRTPHAGIGAYIASTLGKQLLPLQFVIQGHHAGLPDNQDRRENNEDYSEDQKLVSIVKTRFDELFSSAIGVQKVADLPNDMLLTESLTRFLFSALTDADWLDTERHFSPERFNARESATLKCNSLLNALEKHFAELPTDGKINQLRTKARNEAAKHFAEPPGFFSLQLPTGLGKTLTSVYWALLHARHHNLKRIIIVLPYINIIDQTASILKDLFGEDSVLEHHSGIIDDDEEYEKERFDKTAESVKRLACENWDAPIIVTTSVQFFESLFSNKPFKCRKNHNIAESVVIFDEIQTLPKHLAEPTIVMLKNIAALAKTSFLFCTATLPAFAKREGFDGIETIRPLIKNPKTYFDATRRVQYKMLNKLRPATMDTVEEQLSKEKQSCLAIVNTKSVAKDLYKRISKFDRHDQYYHLSTAMCPHHRKRVIANISKDLKAKRRIAVISTQLVEAGVDFDFPCVYRAIAPLDAVIQSAGRCNRNGDPDNGKGRVVLFKLENQKYPDKTYEACAALTEITIKDDMDFLHRTDSFENYYKQVTSLLVDADKYKITPERKEFNFKRVADNYQIIEKGKTWPIVIANYSEESRALLEETLEFFDQTGFILREQYRKLQQYSVPVYQRFLDEHQMTMDKSGLRIWYGGYDSHLGLSPEDIETVF
ncbi:MAG: CRISPR-associated helicase Cas3' [Ignavibacteria bacterium]|nr:CRISPR-associated helicase Cas3' [Ignavibacteria bacterium]